MAYKLRALNQMLCNLLLEFGSVEKSCESDEECGKNSICAEDAGICICDDGFIGDGVFCKGIVAYALTALLLCYCFRSFDFTVLKFASTNNGRIFFSSKNRL